VNDGLPTNRGTEGAVARDYWARDTGRERLLLWRPASTALLAAGAHPARPLDRLGEARGAVGGGRRNLSRIAIAGLEAELLVKRLVRGGAIGGLLGGLAPAARVDREIEAAAAIRAAGGDVPRLVAARVERAGYLPGYGRIETASEYREGCADLATWLASPPQRVGRRAVLAAAGAAVGAMHRGGVLHGDLNLRNVLIDRDGKACLIDLSAARCGGSPSLAARERELARLARSVVKAGLWGGTVSRTDALAFLRGYDEAAARDRLRGVAKRLSRALPFHRIAWATISRRRGQRVAKGA
jgi:tRNA A-37 threonylcarbamoyl transferase component Bud32